MINPLIHLVLFSVYPVLALYSANVYQALPEDTIMPASVILTFSLLAFVVLGRVFKNSNKAALTVSTFVLLVFTYGMIASYLSSIPVLNYSRGWYISVFILGLIFLSSRFYIGLSNDKLRRFTSAANILAVFLVVFPLLTVIGGRLNKNGLKAAADDLSFEMTESVPKEDLPDVYYLILDRYAGDSEIKKNFGYDNSGFLELLRSRGFKVIEGGWANYYSSAHSIASSLNMNYLPSLTDFTLGDGKDWLPLYELVNYHAVGRNFKKLGYRYFHFGSWWWPTSKNDLADRNFNLGLFSEFTGVLIDNSLFHPVINNSNFRFLDSRFNQWRRIRYQFDEMAGIPGIPGPTFVFAHLLIPHEPFVFLGDGSFLESELEKNMTSSSKYTQQLIYLNSRLTALTDAILEKAPDSIIIFQADEGPYPAAYEADSNNYDWSKALAGEKQLKMSILNALYFPESVSVQIPSKLTPVNTFRIVFNALTDASLPLLPDRYFMGNMSRPYDVVEVSR